MSVFSQVEGRHIRTSAAKIAITSLVSLIRELRSIRGLSPKNVLLCTETGKSFRFDLFPEYKSSRIKARNKKRSQDPIAYDNEHLDRVVCSNLVSFAMAKLNIKTVANSTAEADDAIATTWKKIKVANPNANVYVLSTDSDMLQLVMDDSTKMIVAKDGEINYLGSKTMGSYIKSGKNKWEVDHGLEVLLYKALVGDTADSYPGVKGIGMVGWLAIRTALRKAYGASYIETILRIIKNPEYVMAVPLPQKEAALIKTYYDNFVLSLSLGKLKYDVDMQVIVPRVANLVTGDVIQYSEASYLETMRMYGMLSAIHDIESIEVS